MSDFVDRVLAHEPIVRVYVFSGQMAQYAPADRPFVMDFVDMDSEKFAAYGRDARGPMPGCGSARRTACPTSRRETAHRAVVSLFVSEAEAALFRERQDVGLGACRWLERLDLESYRPELHVPDAAPLIVFTRPDGLSAQHRSRRRLRARCDARHPRRAAG